MKLPNFRLYTVQATASLVAALLGLLTIAMLTWFVFHNFDFHEKVVHYNPEAGFGALRRPMVIVSTGAAMLIGVAAGVLGFNSLGQKRNDRQGRSWLGMMIGAAVLAFAPILFYAWQRFSEPLILKIKG